MKKILIMGGTGAMGKYLVPLLAADSSYQVFVTSRSTRQSTSGNLIYLKGNAQELSWIKTIFKTFDFDIVFDFMLYGSEQFQERYLFLLENSGHYFHFSTSRALAEDVILTEECAVKPDMLSRHPEYAIDHYGMRKAREEKALHGSGRKNFTIIRPSMTFSSARFQYFSGDNFDVVRATKNVPTLLPESAVGSMTNLTYGKNVAKMLKALVDTQEATGETYHAVTKSMTWGDIGEIFEKVFGMTYQVVPDAKYLEMVGIEDGRIFDRFRIRNISNKKILARTGLSDEDFGTLEDNLREAWAEADQESYRASRASISAMAHYDLVTGSQVDLASLGEKYKQQYLLSRQKLSEKITIDDFWVRPNPSYWHISPAISGCKGVIITRNDRVAGKDAWLNFRNYNFFFGLKKGATYKAKVEIRSENSFELKPFLHFFGSEILRLNAVHVQPGTNKIEILFQSKVNSYSDLAITATEIKEGSVFEVGSMRIETT